VQASHLSGDHEPIPHADLRLPPRPMLNGRVALHYEENPGAAGGLLGQLPEWLRVPLFHLVGVAALVLMVVLTVRLPAGRRVARLGAALLGGGALSNGVDRWLHGYVVDFLIYRWYPGARGPTFNLADVAICAGVGMLLLESLFQRRPVQTGAERP
jgi:signal peptidase II